MPVQNRRHKGVACRAHCFILHSFEMKNSEAVKSLDC